MKKDNSLNMYQVLLFLLIFILGVMAGKVLLTSKKPLVSQKLDVKDQATNLESTPREERSEVTAKRVTDMVRGDIPRTKQPETAGVADFPETDPDGKYTVQIASFKKIDNAHRYVKQLKNKGYPAFITKALIKENTWYRVRVGTFNDRKKACKYSKMIKSKEKLKTAYAAPK